MSNNPPDTIRIGYQHVKIILEHSHLADTHGSYNTTTAEIHLNQDNAPREVINTLIHEIMHAIWHNYGISDIIDDKHQEYVCNTTANALTQVLLDNRKLLNFVEQGLYGETFGA